MGNKHVGPWRLLKWVRNGSACEIWEVAKAPADPVSVMKLIPPGQCHTKENVAFLKQEYAVGKKLKHPNIVQIHEFGSDPAGTFLILEAYLHNNLKQLLLAEIEGVHVRLDKILRGAAAGLGHLHSKGWVHRDIKPDNFLVDAQGNVKLIDFALATRSKGALGKMLSLKTKVLGTRSYMSPEQIRGHGVDCRSDIYSFGCMIYELVSGKPPFTGATTQELLTKHLRSRAPSLTASEVGVTPSFADLAQRMVAKEPADRPANIEEFLETLGEVKIFVQQPNAN
jgi:serine/threonine protein kinase